MRGPALVGALCAALTAYLAVRFLMRFFETNRLTPFAIYCVDRGRTRFGLLRGHVRAGSRHLAVALVRHRAAIAFTFAGLALLAWLLRVG